MPTLDSAVYWVEYVIRHNGAHHLRSVVTDLQWYQYFLLDVIAFIILTLILSICICYFITKTVKQIICNLLFEKKKIKSL